MCVVTAHALGPVRERLVDVADVLDVLALGVAADRGDVLALVRVVHVREARVVELEIRAAELAEPPHLVPVRGRQVGPEPVQVGIDGRVDRRLAAAVVDHARRRDRQLRLVARHRLLEEAEVVAEDRLRDAELAVDVQRRGRELDVALLVVEVDGDVAGLLRDPVELVDEVHVPGRPAELAVGRRAAARPPPACGRPRGSRRPRSHRSSAASIRPAAASSRAVRTRCGRSRLPTWSARNGGFVRIIGRVSSVVVTAGRTQSRRRPGGGRRNGARRPRDARRASGPRLPRRRGRGA